MALYVNGELIEGYDIINDEFNGEDNLNITLPGHILVDKKNATTWIGDIEEDDAEKMEELFRIDGLQFLNKKIRIFIQVIGNKARQFR